ncbi:unnamed protein product, partial [Acidocella sp. C78]
VGLDIPGFGQYADQFGQEKLIWPSRFAHARIAARVGKSGMGGRAFVAALHAPGISADHVKVKVLPCAAVFRAAG